MNRGDYGQAALVLEDAHRLQPRAHRRGVQSRHGAGGAGTRAGGTCAPASRGRSRRAGEGRTLRAGQHDAGDRRARRSASALLRTLLSRQPEDDAMSCFQVALLAMNAGAPDVGGALRAARAGTASGLARSAAASPARRSDGYFAESPDRFLRRQGDGGVALARADLHAGQCSTSPRSSAPCRPSSRCRAGSRSRSRCWCRGRCRPKARDMSSMLRTMKPPVPCGQDGRAVLAGVERRRAGALALGDVGVDAQAVDQAAAVDGVDGDAAARRLRRDLLERAARVLDEEAFAS